MIRRARAHAPRTPPAEAPPHPWRGGSASPLCSRDPRRHPPSLPPGEPEPRAPTTRAAPLPEEPGASVALPSGLATDRPPRLRLRRRGARRERSSRGWVGARRRQGQDYKPQEAASRSPRPAPLPNAERVTSPSAAPELGRGFETYRGRCAESGLRRPLGSRRSGEAEARPTPVAVTPRARSAAAAWLRRGCPRTRGWSHLPRLGCGRAFGAVLSAKGLSWPIRLN